MPYVSKAQQGYFHTHKKEIGAKVVEEFDKASKGEANLPEHVKGKGKEMKKEREIGIPKSAPKHIKDLDEKADRLHGLKEGSKEDLKADRALMKAHKKSMAMGKKGKIHEY